MYRVEHVLQATVTVLTAVSHAHVKMDVVGVIRNRPVFLALRFPQIRKTAKIGFTTTVFLLVSAHI